MLDLPLALALLADASAAPQVVVTLDNGEFNLPLFTPRWNGRWQRPSAAQEVVSALARVAGANPQVFTYLPPDQGRLGPGGVWPVAPRRSACEGAAAAPTDPCWCGPGDNCWDGVRPNWYAGASTSLWLTAANARRVSGTQGSRIEVHVTDLFEEDPSGAADPKDSDRCVTADGVRRAFSALVTDVEGAPLDHVALGLLRVTADPPPPGGSWGDRYTLAPDPDAPGCHRGSRAGEWSSRSAPWRGTLLVVVLGFGTAEEDPLVSSFLDGMVGQLDTGGFEIELARLREPAAQLAVTRSLDASDLAGAELLGSGRRPSLPCGEVSAAVSLVDEVGLPVPVEASGRCDGGLSVAIDPRELNRSFLRSAGLDPGRRTLALHGTATLSGTADALRERWAAAGALNEGDRPLPLWSSLEPVLFGEGGVARPWRAEVAVAAIEVSAIDRRPWGFASFVGGVLGAAAGMFAASTVQRLHAERALRRHWTRSLGHGRDPRLQIPIASVLGAAQEEVARSWPLRVAAGVAVGTVIAAVLAALVLLAYRVLLG